MTPEASSPLPLPPPIEAKRLSRWRRLFAWITLAVFLLLVTALLILHPFRASNTILLVTYDANREWAKQLISRFRELHPEYPIEVRHAGSITQSRSLSQGLIADLVLLASPLEILNLRTQNQALVTDWPSGLPEDGIAYHSTLVFLVRLGVSALPEDWADLEAKPLQVTIPHPSVSGAGRWAYLAAYGSALLESSGDEATARSRVQRLFSQVNLHEAGARQTLSWFVNQSGIDVLVTWENEALRTAATFPSLYKVVYPAHPIDATPAIARLAVHCEIRKSEASVDEFIRFIFSGEGKSITSKHRFRQGSSNPDLPAISVFSPTTILGTWSEIHDRHFSDSGLLTAILRARELREKPAE